MRIFKNICVGLVTASTLLTLATPIASAEEEQKATSTFYFERQAKTLYDLKLFAGTDPDKYVPNLDGKVTREQGIAMIIRLLGMEQEAKKITAEDIESTLKPYSDKNEISDWAKKYVALSISQKIVKGTSDTVLSPQDPLLGKQFATMILQNLGYTIDPREDYDKAASILVAKGATYREFHAKGFADKELIRDDFVGMAFGSLFAKNMEDKSLIDILVNKKILNDMDKKNALNSSAFID